MNFPGVSHGVCHPGASQTQPTRNQETLSGENWALTQPRVGNFPTNWTDSRDLITNSMEETKQ